MYNKFASHTALYSATAGLGFLLISVVPTVAKQGADGKLSDRWWIEIVQEREYPASVLESRRNAAEQDEAKRVAEAKEKAGKADPKKDEKAEGGAEAREEPAGDVPADEGGGAASGEAKGSKGESPPPDSGKMVMTVAMAGAVVALDGQHLKFRPSLQPGRELMIPLKQVTSLSRRSVGDDTAPKHPRELEYRVVLRDGSEVPGQLSKISGKALTVALAGSGARIDLPLSEITRVERARSKEEGEEKSTLPEQPTRHVALLSSGEIVVGTLLPSRDSDAWLRISSPILTAECPLSMLELLTFPDPDAVAGEAEVEVEETDPPDPKGNNGEPPKAEPGEDIGRKEKGGTEDVREPEETKPTLRHLISLTPSGMLWARELQIRDGNMLVSALGKSGFSVPLSRVESVSFGHEGMPATAPVLVWGGFADKDDEFKKDARCSR